MSFSGDIVRSPNPALRVERDTPIFLITLLFRYMLNLGREIIIPVVGIRFKAYEVAIIVYIVRLIF